MLLEAGADVNKKDILGVTPLHAASGSPLAVESVKLLLEAGADVNAKTNIGKTPLNIAKEKGHSEIVKLLIKYGAKSP